MKATVHVYQRVADLNEALVVALLRLLEAAVSRRGFFSWVLAGGSTPRGLYELLAERYQARIPWDKVYVFWGDERLVPADHPDSNEHMAQQALLSKVPIPSKNIFSMASVQTPDKAAAAYERRLRDFFQLTNKDQFPSFDLVLLGLGEDGHTASLFPDHPVLDEEQRWVAGLLGPESRPPRERITFTLPLINQAQHVFFLTVGTNKRDILNDILNDPQAAARYPAARVQPQGSLHWFVDQAARDESD